MKHLLPLLLFAAAPALASGPGGADIVILGEIHDSAPAHQGQAEVLASLQPTAVVFEMFTPADAARANADRDTIPAIWATMAWPDYRLYAPVFDALGDAVILGAAAPRETIRAVFADGAAAVFGPDAARFGLDTPLPPAEQSAREALQFAAHCEAMPPEMMPGMVEVQRFRDAQFAQAALAALAQYGAPVAVITGNGHARADWGVPALIAQAAPEVATHTIAFTEAGDQTPYETVRIVPPVDRPDPCAALRNP